MHILITKTFSDLGVTYTAGEKIHVATSVAERFFQGKVAERVKYKTTAEYLSVVEAERARLNPILPAVVTWMVVKDVVKERWAIVAKCSRANCSRFSCFSGPPSAALESLTFLHSCGEVTSVPITPEVCAQYRKVFHRRFMLSYAEAYAAKCAAPSIDKPYLTAEEISNSNAARGATSEDSPAKHAGFTFDIPYKTPQELMKENLKRAPK
jgi:hypothetical protein